MNTKKFLLSRFLMFIIYEKDGNGNEHFMEYDLAGRLLKKITPDGKVQTIDYDIVNNTIVETTANGNKIGRQGDGSVVLRQTGQADRKQLRRRKRCIIQLLRKGTIGDVH